jgi:hypothetical protein
LYTHSAGGSFVHEPIRLDISGIVNHNALAAIGKAFAVLAWNEFYATTIGIFVHTNCD